jgi:hypothetical protein
VSGEQQIMRTTLCVEFYALWTWLERWVDAVAAKRIAIFAMVDIFERSFAGRPTVSGVFAELYALATKRLERILQVRRLPPPWMPEDTILLPAPEDLRLINQLYASCYHLAVSRGIEKPWFDQLVADLLELGDQEDPAAAFVTALEDPASLLYVLAGQFAQDRAACHQEELACRLSGRLWRSEDVKSLEWLDHMAERLEAVSRGEAEQNRDHVGCNTDKNEHSVQGDGDVRDAEPGPGLWSATGPAADYRGDR